MGEKTRKNKHLTNEERTEIESCLSKRMTFKDIGRYIGKDATTISYEVKHHRMEHKSGFTKIDGTCPLLLKAPFVCLSYFLPPASVSQRMLLLTAPYYTMNRRECLQILKRFIRARRCAAGDALPVTAATEIWV